MTLREAQNYQVTDVEDGRKTAQAILELQLEVHKGMIDIDDNDDWKKLSDLHYDLRKQRQRILHETGLLAMKLKRKKAQ